MKLIKRYQTIKKNPLYPVEALQAAMQGTKWMGDENFAIVN